LAQIIDGMHVASSAVWVGGFLVLATSARPLFLTGHDQAYALEDGRAPVAAREPRPPLCRSHRDLLISRPACCGTGPRGRPSPITLHRVVCASFVSPPWNRSWPFGFLGCTALLAGASPPRQGSPGATHHAAAAGVSTALVEHVELVGNTHAGKELLANRPHESPSVMNRVREHGDQAGGRGVPFTP
jgi:hypothetical protein